MSELDTSRRETLTPQLGYREMEESVEVSHIGHPEDEEPFLEPRDRP